MEASVLLHLGQSEQRFFFEQPVNKENTIIVAAAESKTGFSKFFIVLKLRGLRGCLNLLFN